MNCMVNGWGQIGHRFADASACFGNQQMAVVKGFGNGPGHINLLVAHFVVFFFERKGPRFPKEVTDGLCVYRQVGFVVRIAKGCVPAYIKEGLIEV